jgi:hypothetical protein
VFGRIINKIYIENYLEGIGYGLFENTVTDFINALPGKISVNTNISNNKRETVFSMRSARTWT